MWVNIKALIGIFSQNVGPSLAIWANPVQLSFVCRRGFAALRQASRYDDLLALLQQNLDSAAPPDRKVRHRSGGKLRSVTKA